MTLAPEPRARLSRRPSFPLAQAGQGCKRGRSAVRRSPVLALPAAQVQSNSALCTEGAGSARDTSGSLEESGSRPQAHLPPSPSLIMTAG